MPKKLRIGIVGAGAIVLERHLPALLAMPEVEIIAISNSTYESSERFCQTHLRSATPMKNWADLLALPDLDIVWIGTQPYLHAPISVSALEAGKHVFCQARMAMNLAEAREMQETARRFPHLVTMLCPPPFGMKGDRWVRQLLAEGRIGRPQSVMLQSLASFGTDPNTPAHWRQREELSGLNVLTLGIYAEVLQRWLGPIQAVSAQGKVVHPFRQHYEVRIPDQLQVLAEFENGTQGTLTFSGVAPVPAPSVIRIDGDEGTLLYQLDKDELFFARRGDSALAPLPIPPELAQEWQVERQFIDAVLHPDHPRPQPDFDEGVAYMKVVQAVSDSLNEARRILI